MSIGATVTLQWHIGRLICKHGGLRAAADAVGIDAGYLSRLGSGQKSNPTKAMLKKLGLRKVITYKTEHTHG